jgi:hypothetical protein
VFYQFGIPPFHESSGNAVPHKFNYAEVAEYLLKKRAIKM